MTGGRTARHPATAGGTGQPPAVVVSIAAVVAGAGGVGAQALATRIQEAARAYAGGEPHDDMAVLVLGVPPEEGGN